jgi:protein TonB
VVVLLHVVIIYALVTGLARRMVEVIRHPIETKIIEEAKPVPDTPPPVALPTPKFEVSPPPYIPPPEIHIQQPPPQPAPIVVTTPVKPAAPTPPPVARAVEAPPHNSVHTPPVIDAARCEKPEYPPAARRFGETGTVVLRILVGVDGKVISSEVQTSSGSKRLDEAARQGLGLCRFKPGMVDGKPEQAWATLRYAWKLQD